MKPFLTFGAALALFSSVFAACTMDFDQFQPGGGGNGGSGGSGGSCAGECCVAADCPAPSAACVVAACVSSTCTEVPAPDGTELATQTVGDCKKDVCQGGAVATENDDADPLDDGDDCTADTCENGSPITMPEPAGTSCTMGGALCDGMGDCVQCLMDVDCPAEAPKCDMNQCVPQTCSDTRQNGTETDVDCGGGACPPCDVGEDCDAGADCTSGVCAPNGNCAAPDCNDGVENGDETDVDCGGSCFDECGPGEGCDENNDCEGDECTGVGGTCVPNCDDNEQTGAETDVDCGGGACDGCDIGDMCAGDDANCLSGNCGANDLCAPKPTGTTCMADDECQSGDCEDGICCATSCNGVCESCALAGFLGTCTDIATGQDPNNECPGAQICDGNGACKKVAGEACGGANECLAGLFCVDGVCCGTQCAGTCQACNVAGMLGTCTDVPMNTDPANECGGLTSCNGAGACNKLPNGQACGGNTECTSNFCVDGVCCNEGCGGTLSGLRHRRHARRLHQRPEQPGPRQRVSGRRHLQRRRRLQLILPHSGADTRWNGIVHFVGLFSSVTS